VRVTDEFMRAVEEDGEWQTRELVIPTEGKVMAVDVSVEQTETAPGDEDKGT